MHLNREFCFFDDSTFNIQVSLEKEGDDFQESHSCRATAPPKDENIVLNIVLVLVVVLVVGFSITSTRTTTRTIFRRVFMPPQAGTTKDQDVVASVGDARDTCLIA
jgi:hypothetical protein